ncbi:MAG: hypothetical protein ACOZQL_03205 [Myxococcota bacterium]
MEPENLTIRLLQEIRDEVRRSSDRSDQRFEKMDQRFEKMDQRFEKMDQRFELIETTLRDLAQQMVMLGRGIKTVEQRLDALEKLGGH